MIIPSWRRWSEIYGRQTWSKSSKTDGGKIKELSHASLDMCIWKDSIKIKWKANVAISFIFCSLLVLTMILFLYFTRLIQEKLILLKKLTDEHDCSIGMKRDKGREYCTAEEILELK
jgi:hypothetical protein